MPRGQASFSLQKRPTNKKEAEVTTQVPAFFLRAPDGTGANQFRHEAV